MSRPRWRARRAFELLVAAILPVATVTFAAEAANPTGNEPPAPCVSRPTSGAPMLKASGALVVTDVSGSMRGFASSKSTRLYTLHDSVDRAIRKSLEASSRKGEIRRCILGETLDCQTAVPLSGFDSAATYKAKESRLDLFISQGASSIAPAAQAATSEKPRDLLDENLVSVLVTDGMQVQQGGADAGPCLGGADPECMVSILKARVEAGYGIWMTLVYLPFNGVHFAERPLDDSHWRRVKEHIESLSSDARFAGQEFSASRGSGTPFTSFTFKGVKPILLFVLTRDPELGRLVVGNLKAGLQRERVPTPEKGIFVTELAPMPGEVRQITHVGLRPGAPSEGVRPIASKRTGGFFDYLVEVERGASTPLRLTWKGAPTPLPQGAARSWSLVPLGGTLPSANVVVRATGAETVDLDVSSDRLKPGAFFQWLGVQSRIVVKDTGTFWADLSAENNFETPEKLYGLREVADGILGAATRTPTTVDCLRVRVERK